MDPVAVLAVITTPVATLVGVAVTLDHQRKQATAQDQRRLREARYARVRQALGKLLSIGLQIELAADEPMITTPVMREELANLLKEIADSWPAMRDARAEILCEPDGQVWIDEFEDLVLQPFKAVRIAVAQQQVDRREEVKTVKAGVARFRAAVVAHLAELERPI